MAVPSPVQLPPQLRKRDALLGSLPKPLSDVLLLLPVREAPPAQLCFLPILLMAVEQLQRAAVGSP